MKYIDAEKLIAEIERLKELHKGLLSGKFRSGYYSAFQQVRSFIESLQQEQPDVDLENTAQHVYESWMGGTMDDVRRDMVELGKALNAKK